MDSDTEIPARTLIEQEAVELLDEHDHNINAIELASQLDVGHWCVDDEYPEWHSKKELETMIRALLLRELEGYTTTELRRQLRDDETARRLGFDVDDTADDSRSVPARTTFSRTWRNRLSVDLRRSIEHAAARIREYAHEIGVPVGLPIFESEPEDKSELSSRTKNRLIGETSKEVLKHVSRLVFPEFEIKRDGRSPYEDGVYLGAECMMSLNNDAAEGGMEAYGDGVRTVSKALNDDDEESDSQGIPSTSEEGMEALLEALTDTDVDDLVDSVEQEPDTPTGEAHLDAIRTFSRADMMRLSI